MSRMAVDWDAIAKEVDGDETAQPMTMKDLPEGWNASEEQRFRAWYTPIAEANGIDTNPDDPAHHYNYRAAFRAGASPGPDRHWPSQFKDATHPNRYVDGEDTITGRPAQSVDWDAAAAEVDAPAGNGQAPRTTPGARFAPESTDADLAKTRAGVHGSTPRDRLARQWQEQNAAATQQAELDQARDLPYAAQVGARALGAVQQGAATTEREWHDLLFKRGTPDIQIGTPAVQPEYQPQSPQVIANAVPGLQGTGSPAAQEAIQKAGAGLDPVSGFVADLAGMPPTMVSPSAIVAMLITHAPTSELLATFGPPMLSKVEQAFGPRIMGAVSAELSSAIHLGMFSGAQAAAQGKSGGDVVEAGLHGAEAGLAFGFPGALRGSARVVGSEGVAPRDGVRGLDAGSSGTAPPSNRQAAVTPTPERSELLPPSEPSNGKSPTEQAKGEPSGRSDHAESILAKVQQDAENALREGREPTPVPESPDTLAAQVEGLTSGKRPAVLVTPGAAMPDVPEGFDTLKTEAGTFIFDREKVKPGEIRQAVKNRTIGDVLGYGIADKPAEPIGAVVVRTPEGVEKQAVMTDETSLARVAEAAREVADPGDTIKLEDPQQVIADRVEAGAKTQAEARALAEQLKIGEVVKERSATERNVAQRSATQRAERAPEPRPAEPAPAREEPTNGKGQEEGQGRPQEGLLKTEGESPAPTGAGGSLSPPESPHPQPAPQPLNEPRPVDQPPAPRQSAKAEGGKLAEGAGGTHGGERTAPATLEQRFLAFADNERASRRASAVKPGRRSGGTTLIGDVVSIAAEYAARAAAAGIKGGKALNRFVRDALSEYEKDASEYAPRITRLARAMLEDARKPDGTLDADLFERSVSDARQAVTRSPKVSVKGVREATGQSKPAPTVTEGQALRAGMGKAAKAAREAYRSGRDEANDKAAAAMSKFREQIKSADSVSDAMRKRITRMVLRNVDKSERGRFLGDVARASTSTRLIPIMERMQQANADARLRSAVAGAGRVAKRVPRNLLEELRTERDALKAQLKAIRKDGAWRQVKDLPGKERMIGELRTIKEGFDRIAHEQKEWNKLRIEGKVLAREAVVPEIDTAVRAKHKELAQRTDLVETRYASPQRQIVQAHMNPQAIGASLGHPAAERLLTTELWDGETLVQRDAQRGTDALRKAVEAAGYEWGSTDLQKLSRAAMGDDAARTTMKLPDAGEIKATPAEWMDLWATLDDAWAGDQIRNGAPINWRRDPRGKPIKLTPADADAVMSGLDPKLVGIVRAMKQHVEENVRPGVFKAFREQMGYDLKPIERYWRTMRNREQTDVSGVVSSARAQFKKALEQLSFEKERESNLRTPYLVGDFFDSFHQIAHQGAVVAHMTRRVRQAEAVFFDKRVKGAIEATFGEGMNRRISQIIEQGKILFGESRPEVDRAFKAISRNVSRAKLSLNPFSMMKNSTGVFKYLAYMSPKDVAAGVAWASKPGNIAEVVRSPFFRNRFENPAWARVSPLNTNRTPILGETDLSFLMRNLVTMKKWKPNLDTEAVGDLIDRIRIYDQVDKWVVAVGWGAKLAERKRLGLTALEGESHARDVEHLVRRTQNGISALERSGFAQSASDGSIASLVTPFTADNNKSFNMIAEGFARGKKEGMRALAAVTLGNAVASTISRVAREGLKIAVLAALGIPYKRDDKVESVGEKTAWDFLRSVTGLAYGGDLVADVGKGIWDSAHGRRGKVVDFTNPTIDAMTRLAAGIGEVGSAFFEDGPMRTGPNRGESRMWVKIKRGLEKAALAGADLAGVPVSPLYYVGQEITHAAD